MRVVSSPGVSEEDRGVREEIWRFLKELIGLSKCTQPSNQMAFFRYA